MSGFSPFGQQQATKVQLDEYKRLKRRNNALIIILVIMVILLIAAIIAVFTLAFLPQCKSNELISVLFIDCFIN